MSFRNRLKLIWRVNRLFEICSLSECEAFADIGGNTTTSPESNITNIDNAPNEIRPDFGNLLFLSVHDYIMSAQHHSRSFVLSNTIPFSSFRKVNVKVVPELQYVPVTTNLQLLALVSPFFALKSSITPLPFGPQSK